MTEPWHDDATQFEARRDAESFRTHPLAVAIEKLNTVLADVTQAFARLGTIMRAQRAAERRARKRSPVTFRARGGT
ncbi:MAG: hypothetical protein JWM95_1709 [Gemmatimonadetes bacterium]|nr:hypothetical protein [Gemmatimonadota bacterium]